MESFKYIYNQPGILDADLVLENRYSQAGLINKFVVRDEGRSLYYVFKSYIEFFEFMNTVPESERNFHEVIFGFMPQKLKFDIDADYNDVCAIAPNDNPDNVIKMIINSVINAIDCAYLTLYGNNLDLLNDCIYCRSMHKDEPKYSYHIILNKVVVDNNNADKFTKHVISMLPLQYHKFLDISVNKSLQCFRIIGCCKTKSLRKKVLLSQGKTPEDTLITNITGCEILPDIIIDRKENHQESPLSCSEDVKKTLEMVKEVSKAFTFRHESSCVLLFDRIYPSYCDICHREHSSDNSLIVNMFYYNDIVKVSYSCRRDPSSRKVQLGEFISAIYKRPDAPSAGSSRAENGGKHTRDKYLAEVIKTAISTPTGTLFDKLPQKNVYSEPTLRPFEFAHTLCVRAAMKMGKTKALMEHLKAYNSTLLPPVIRFISFRQTFSHNIKEKFPDFVLYSDVKGPLYQNKLIIQVESLHRLEIRDEVDLVILDECESIFEQFDSGLLRNFNAAFAAFQWLMRTSKRVICLDAALGDRSYNILTKMRPGFEQCGLYHYNTFQNATSDNYRISIKKSQWLSLLYNDIKANKRIAIPISNLTEAKVMAADISKKYPSIRVKLYSSETSMSERKMHFGDVNTYWSQYDVLLYTPTVSAGVSFEVSHFDVVYGYFTELSCPVETCIQMIGRIRDVKSRQYNIYLEGDGNNLPQDVAEITKLIYLSRDNLSKVIDNSMLAFEYGPKGEIKYYNTDYFHLYVQNMRVRNISRNIFIKHFIHSVAATGAKISAMRTMDTLDASICDDAILTEYKTIRQDIQNIEHKNVATAMELTPEQYMDIKLANIAGEEIDSGMKNACKLYQLRQAYDYYSAMDARFVAQYDRGNVKRWYRNLCRISQCNNIMISLEIIRRDELKNYINTMESNDENRVNNDINRRYVYDQHRIAVSLLHYCGWESLRDKKYISLWSLNGNIKMHEGAIMGDLDMIYYYFGAQRMQRLDLKKLSAARESPPTYITLMLAVINRVLYVMYGAKIQALRGEMYQLLECDMFTYSHDNTQRPFIPAGIISEDIMELDDSLDGEKYIIV